jgi:glycosyltransferase involved in cell wall biosynthesis
MLNRNGEHAKNLKILFFYQDFGQRGGIERYLQQTAQWLKDVSARPETGYPRIEPVLVCSENTPLYRQLQAAGHTVYGVPNRPFFAKSFLRSLDVPTWLRLAAIVKREKPDLAHVHIGLLENLLFQWLGVPVVYTAHGYGTLYSGRDVPATYWALPKKIVKAVTRFLFRQTAARVDALLFVSEAEKSRMAEEGYLPRNQAGTFVGNVMPNGLPIESLRQQAASADGPALKARLGIPAQARCISFINRLDANKNPLDFVALAHHLTENFAQETAGQNASLTDAPGPLHFLIAGEGPLLPDILAQSRGLPNVHILGYQSELSALLSITDVLVYPARREGFGLGLVEAMAVGVPCVAYASEGASEILAGPELETCLVPVDDFPALLQAVKRTLQLMDLERSALQRALQRALQSRAADFDKAIFMERLMAVYRHLCPRVSVILPVYNGEATILRAVRSVLNQTYPHLELLVVDDGSTDTTLEKLAVFQNHGQDARLRVIRQANQGVAMARNTAFAHATGDYIAFIDADDLWLPQKLATELAIVRKRTTAENPACLVYSGYYALNDQDQLIHCPPLRQADGDLSRVVLEDEGLFLPSTSVLHRQGFEAVGGFQSRCYHEDRVFFIQACRQFPAYATGQRLVLYRQSLSGRCRRVLQNYDDALNAEMSIIDALQAHLSSEEREYLARLQARNLLCRFLMYGYQAQALHLYASHLTDKTLFTGKKGLLVRLSFISGINFLLGARLFIQAIYQNGYSPMWSSLPRIRALLKHSENAENVAGRPVLPSSLACQNAESVAAC